MARKSTASLSVVPVAPLGRISAPKGLSAAELALWRAVVDSKPAEWFGEDSAPLLVEYVRVSAMCDHLDAVVKAAMEGGDFAELDAALRCRDRESKRLLSIGTKLRLTQQSRYTPKAAATAAKKASGARPWQA